MFQLPATAELTDRIRDLYGNELLQQLTSARQFEFVANPDPRLDRAGGREPANARAAARFCEWPRD